MGVLCTTDDFNGRDLNVSTSQAPKKSQIQSRRGENWALFTAKRQQGGRAYAETVLLSAPPMNHSFDSFLLLSLVLLLLFFLPFFSCFFLFFFFFIFFFSFLLFIRANCAAKSIGAKRLVELDKASCFTTELKEFCMVGVHRSTTGHVAWTRGYALHLAAQPRSQACCRTQHRLRSMASFVPPETTLGPSMLQIQHRLRWGWGSCAGKLCSE